jgi:hypothetical protein
MKKISHIFFLLIFLAVFSNTSNGQTIFSGQIPLGHVNFNPDALLSNPYTNPVILKHYTTQDLQWMKANDSIKFKTISYYYTQSFIAEKIISCDGCREFDPFTFDVFDYERFRQKSTRYERIWLKYGFKLTLLSIDELTYKLPIHTAIH